MSESRFKSRKFILAAATLLASTWLASEFIVDADIFMKVVLGTVGAYILGNVAQKATVKDGPQ